MKERTLTWNPATPVGKVMSGFASLFLDGYKVVGGSELEGRLILRKDDEEKEEAEDVQGG